MSNPEASEPRAEAQSTLGVQLQIAKSAIRAAIEYDNTLWPDMTVLRRESMEVAQAAIDQAIWHYDNDKLSDIGAEITGERTCNRGGPFG